LSNFVTAKAITMNSMFSYCESLATLDISKFNTTKATNMESMFSNCRSLETIYVGDGWSVENVTNSDEMFNMCQNLVGGMGTTYNANHIDAEYAHVDGGASNPGYFTTQSTFIRGDVNGDGVVGIADVTALIDIIFSTEAMPINFEVVDVYADGIISISDATTLLDYLITGTW